MSELRSAARIAVLLLAFAASAPAQQDLDVVLSSGRVLDPETGLDAIRHVGIRGRHIVAISEVALNDRVTPGGSVVDARGLFVAPGFIDIHAHGQSQKAHEYQVHDGVTTALELEWGYPRLEEWIESKRGKSLIHFGASVSHGLSRTLAMPGFELDEAKLIAAATADEPLRPLGGLVEEGFYRGLADEPMKDLFALLQRGLEEGAIGLGVSHQYYPGADRREIFRVFQFAADRDVPIFTHVRSMGADAIQEVIANAAVTGASVHIVHVNSSSLGDLPLVLDLIGAAQRRGIDVTTEAYPYTAASTGIGSSIFDDGWQERLGISYGDVQWQDTGERLTEETFRKYREEGGTVIIHLMQPDLIDLAVTTPFVMIGSDGMPYAPGAHPRSAGTFSRVLGRYVRERELLDLMEALGKMTILPARRLESIAPAMKKKGRLRVGADADITVFDFERIRDTATFEDDLSYSEGIIHVLVDGVFVVRDSRSVEGVFPGTPILGRYHEPRAGAN